MNLAHQAWELGNVAYALDILERQRPAAGAVDLRGFEWGYLWQLCGGGRQPGMALHDRPISRLAFSADGALLASGAEDGTIVHLGPRQARPAPRSPRTPRTGHGPDILPRWEAPGLGVLGRGPLGRTVGPGHGAGTMAPVRSLSFGPRRGDRG